jgi:hypothetical protein
MLITQLNITCGAVNCMVVRLPVSEHEGWRKAPCAGAVDEARAPA